MKKIIEAIRGVWNDREKKKELLLYVAFGLATTAVNWIVYEIMRRLVGLDALTADPVWFRIMGNVCNTTAWIVSVLFAFFTNKKYVFQSREHGWRGAGKEFLLFVSARLLSYFLFDIGLYTLLLYVMPDRLDKLITNVLVVIFNYFASKLVIFKKTKR
ncbi:MAG: GtrA family protein [Clostridia bacterium]|nr:GtrA family protein [Clostridia bacterium]